MGNEAKVVEEYCWAITQAVRRSCCSRLGFSVPEFGFLLDSLVNPYITYHIYTQTQLTQTSKSPRLSVSR
jgi:hypothetical protein